MPGCRGAILRRPWVLRLIAGVVPFVRLWPFGRPIFGIPSWGLVVVDGSTAFRLPGGGFLSVVDRKEPKSAQGLCPWTLPGGSPWIS